MFQWSEVCFLEDMKNLVTSSMLFIVLTLDSVESGVDSLDLHLLLVLYLHFIHIMISLDHLILITINGIRGGCHVIDRMGEWG